MACLIILCASRTPAQEITDAQKLYDSGKYNECIQSSAKAIEASPWNSRWWILKLRAELTTGRYAEALKTYEAASERYDDNLSLLLLGCDVLQANGRPAEAAALLARISGVAGQERYDDAAGRAALGRAMLRSGVDARKVLETVLDKAKKEFPQSPEPRLAIGDLALQKHDYALAAEAFGNAARLAPEDPDAYLGLARSYENDPDRASAALAKALELNPHHIDTLLFQADNLIDREDTQQASELLTKVLEINPKQPRAWAYRAVLAHLSGDRRQEESCRTQALGAWKTNPEVDYLIGLKLSQKYRFAEGAAHQRTALGFDPGYLPARIQLCQDLLRLNKEDEGWQLADEVFKADPYNIVTYNLTTLHDTLKKFRTLEDAHFAVRMDPREAQIYGDSVLKLLDRARQTLCEKYGVQAPDQTTVEIFPQQKDFAIRTFGLPGGAGYLGVCFGPVITVNSPASRIAHPSNWQAVLWHEFCHTVTLTRTRNKMPRWLSEGISVYEERQANPSWGQRMTPAYRELILAGGATPVSSLSGAFLHPPTPMHLQFAYYESSMVVDYIVGRFGAPALRAVLTDLGNDVAINTALSSHTEPIEKLDTDFAAWLKEQAGKLAPGADLTQPETALDADSAAMAAWNKEHPNSFWGLLGQGRALIAERKWKEAIPPLEKAVALYPDYAEAGGPYLLLAAAHRELGDAALEKHMLQKHVALDADAVEPRLRLIELATRDKDWAAASRFAEQVLAINPLLPAPYECLATAAEKLGDRPLAIRAERTLLLMDPLDRPGHHYRLAKLLMEEKQFPDARHEVVLALEDAPRFRDALHLLVQIADQMDATRPAPATRPTTAPVPSGENRIEVHP